MKILFKNGLDLQNKVFDILIENETILEIGTQLKCPEANVIDLKSETYVSAGWIDIHTHAYKHFKLYADDPDEMGYKLGVTTVVDAGTTGGDTISSFALEARHAKTRVHALINIARQGIVSQDELSNLDNIDFEIIRKAVKDNPEFIIGLKARMSASVVGQQGIKPLIKGKEIAHELGMKMMVHIGTQPPHLNQVLDLMEKDDIVTHVFNGKANGIFNDDGSLLPQLIHARNRGVYFDIGHGRDSFSFDVAKRALACDFMSDTISSDIYSRNRLEGPVYSLACTMNKLLFTGYSLEKVIDSVTAQAATVMGFSDRGVLEVGKLSDLTFFKVDTIHQELTDSVGKSVHLDKGVIPTAVVLKGVYYEIK